VVAREHVIHIPRPPDNTNLMEYYEETVSQLVDFFKKDVSPTDKIGVVIRSDTLTGEPLGLSYRNADNLGADTLWQLIYRVTQSNADFLMQGNIEVKVQVVTLPRGYGRNLRARFVSNFLEFSEQNRGIIAIPNDRGRCLSLALAVGLSLLECVEKAKGLAKDLPRLRRRARELRQLADCDLEHGATYEEIERFQDVLPYARIIVFNELKGKSIYFDKRPRDVDHVVPLLLVNDHYSVILSYTAAFGCSYFCRACYAPYNNPEMHNCRAKCQSCTAMPPCNREPNFDTTCATCGRWFKSQTCYNNHLVNKMNKDQTVCQCFFKCETCQRTYRKFKGRKPHICGEFYCKNCGTHAPNGHECYMKPDERPGPPCDKKTLFVYWDCETQQNVEQQDENGQHVGYLHVVNLIVAQTQCHMCVESDHLERYCEHCGVRQWVFKTEPLREFLNFLSIFKKTFTKVIALAHYSKGFDSVLVFKYVLENIAVRPKLIMKGTSIFSLHVGNVKFIDSYNFMSIPLAQLPSTLGLPVELKKGWFPHLYNTRENAEYCGEIPDEQYFDPEGMMPDVKEKFLQWHREERAKGENWSLKAELVSYCVNDVTILRLACRTFRNLIMKIANLDPFMECITLASVASLTFRRNFLRHNTIGVLPPRGYRRSDAQSKIGLMWLLWEERVRQVVIKHAGRGREVRLPCGILCDGFLKLDTGTEIVFMFSGCLWHGCSSCHPEGQTFPLNNDPFDTLGLRREKTDSTLKKLGLLGYTVVHKKECQFRQELKQNRAQREYLENHPLIVHEPLDPRLALYGGRVEALKQYHICEEGEEIRYVDFVSLYPYICMHFQMPIGHPTIHTGPDFPDLQTCEGLIKCRVIAPANLYIPVLPVRLHGKLLFALCMACANDMHQGPCTHEDPEERALTGTWVIPEVRKALQVGYRVTNIYEVWEYQTSQYDEATREGGIFVDYIRMCLKLKAEASGYPPECEDDESKKMFVDSYFEKEGIRLDADNIKYNPGMRWISKNLACSLWGRLALNVHRTETCVVSEPRELFAKLCDPNTEVNEIICIGKDSVLVHYNVLKELLNTDPTVNVVIAAYVTAGARLKLYSNLETLQQRCYYMDTDSYCYGLKRGDAALPVGSFLGELSNELPRDCFISELAAGGPKNYGAVVINRTSRQIVKTILKVRGIRLDSRSCEKVNFNILKNMILEGNGESRLVYPHKIKRFKDQNIMTISQTTTYRVIYTKRWIDRNTFLTYPYGYNTDRA
jgi:hypothetical protein